MNRPKVPKDAEAAALLRCRRRCCICYGLHRNVQAKPGQIAHLDKDASNNKIENLVFLCFEHHDAYDSQTSQSKGFTLTEVKVYRAELEESMAAALAAPISLSVDRSIEPTWEGLYRWEEDNASAELEISSVGLREIAVRGIAFWGTKNPLGPNIGELDGVATPKGSDLRIQQDDYIITLRKKPEGLEAEESKSGPPIFGMNVSFAGRYSRVPDGAEALPQPPLESFESEFWPNEGRLVFTARVKKLILRARPHQRCPSHRGDYSPARKARAIPPLQVSNCQTRSSLGTSAR